MPPCAFEELFACSEPFVATATRAPARSAETAAARPEAPLPITSTSKESVSGTPSTLPNSPNANHENHLSEDAPEELLELGRRGRPRVPFVAHAPGRHLGDRGQVALGHAEVSEALEAAEARELLDGVRLDRAPERADRVRHDLLVEAER